MRFISVYLFLALVSVGFAVPLSAEKDADRSLEARSNSGPNSGPSKPNRGNFYDDPDDGPNGITMEEALRRQQAKDEARLQKGQKKTGFGWPTWKKGNNGGNNGGEREDEKGGKAT
ncbi:hypothetical protein F5876DRAFT_63163 [Lentinula aff. lateritia]|uniref:Uncharacterized protein n=1 Tax=Lentinula aff. lateritia TaxID=2804960 RepID=A0ACC1UA35_9AGAR|nr:hypothetical protein F5876DRAFT_63163 [Lentinula aff. lateritia]